MLKALPVELHRALEKSESQSPHQGVTSILLGCQVIHSITPAAHRDRLEATFETFDAFQKMSEPLVASLFLFLFV